jgi:hypothetical protein
MARLRLDIGEDSYLQLMKIAAYERRPIGWQAEIMLLRAIADYCSPGQPGELYAAADPDDDPGNAALVGKGPKDAG